MTDLAYKVLDADRRSCHGGTGLWTPGRPRSVRAALVPCQHGIHFCRRDQLVQWLGPTIWVFEDLSPDETIDAGDKMVTRKGRIVEQVETWNETTARLFAADVAEVALVYIPESHRDPFVAAVNAARGYARGEIGDKERDAAGAAARAAAGDAAGAAARAAAWDAAEAAARDAAWAAAWAAAGAAARDAAGDAAGAAARDAAGAAAWAAAGAAAWAAARAAQTEILFDYLEGRRS